jgi:16S rRNA processing protein RimM
LAERLVLLGSFGAPHGVRGEIRLKSFTERPEAIASYGALTTEDGRLVELVSVRPAKTVLIARVRGVGDRTAAEALANARLFVERDRLGDAADDEFFHADLIGLRAESLEGAALGTIAAIHDFGAGDILEIRPEGGGAILVPFTTAVVPLVEIAARRIVVVLPDEVGEREPGT